MAAGVLPLAGSNGYGKAILSRRNRAEIFVIVSAEWVVCGVEIQSYFTVFGRIRFEESSGSIGFMTVGCVTKDKE